MYAYILITIVGDTQVIWQLLPILVGNVEIGTIEQSIEKQTNPIATMKTRLVYIIVVNYFPRRACVAKFQADMQNIAVELD